MLAVHSVKELINTLYRSRDLLTEMFEKRKLFAYKYEQALEILDEDAIETLKSKGIIRQNGPHIDIE